MKFKVQLCTTDDNRIKGVLIYMHVHLNWEGNVRNVRVLIESKRFLLLFPQAKALWEYIHLHGENCISHFGRISTRNYSRC